MIHITFIKDEVLRRKRNYQVKIDVRVIDNSTLILLINIQMLSLYYFCHTGFYKIANNTTCYNDTKRSDNEDVYTPSLELLIVAGCTITPIIVLAIAGNILTIMSFVRDSRLHKTYNIYILNLAIADLLIALISMPIYLIYILKGNVLLFGGIFFCKIWILFDFNATMVTVVLMVHISYDRLILLNNWPMYIRIQTQKRVCTKCVLTWVLVLLVNRPAIIGWDIWTGVDIVEPNDCVVQCARNFIYTLIVILLEFVTPSVVLILFNSLVVRQIRNLKRKRKELSADTCSNNEYIYDRRSTRHGYDYVHQLFTSSSLQESQYDKYVTADDTCEN